ncbi:MAG: HlyD family efflux transporter periplasmic adaptor subunit [Lachnospiraceae bacterium]|nr:HlyD family efflux transporter periplasmic adaptor subunit [Lachnospiraceae bacterium]
MQSKDGKSRNKGSKKKAIIIILAVLVLAAIGGIAFFMLKVWNKGDPADPAFRGGGGAIGGNPSLPEDMVTASGVISVEVTEESFAVENLSTALEIEEIYISSGQELEEGTRILRLSEESVAEAREELEKTLRTAELAYRAGVIEYEQKKITARYDYESAVLAGEQAREVYLETVAGLTDSVERAQEALAEAQEQIAEYQSYVNDGSYQSYFKVDEYQAIYDENLAVLKQKMEEWGVSWEQVTGGRGGSPYSYESILASLYSVLEQNLRDLQQAQSDYEDAVANAAFELQTLELQLPSLQQAVAEAKEAYEIQAAQAELTYETALASAQRAESDYATTLEKAEADYETLLSDYEDAQENLELFESSVGDGYYYASGTGSVLRVMLQAGQELTSDRAIYMYSDTQEMSVTVSVAQTDIAKLAVGDEVYLMDTGGNGYSGKITAVNPVTASDSRTNVTYNVTVNLTGDISGLTANQSVTVIFGMTREAEATAPANEEREVRE